jgi:hypothetical protein
MMKGTNLAKVMTVVSLLFTFAVNRVWAISFPISIIIFYSIISFLIFLKYLEKESPETVLKN